MKKFDDLLNDLENLQKADPLVDPDPAADPVADPAADPVADPVADPAADPVADPAVDPAVDPAPAGELKKSLILADGTEVDIEDAAPLMKSLKEQMNEFQGRLDDQAEGFGKVLQAQTDLVKSLHAEIQTLRNEGSGRKSVVLSMVERQTTGVTAPQEVTREQVMTKCMSAQEAGKLTAFDVAVAEASLNRGTELPARISAAIG